MVVILVADLFGYQIIHLDNLLKVKTKDHPEDSLLPRIVFRNAISISDKSTSTCCPIHDSRSEQIPHRIEGSEIAEPDFRGNQLGRGEDYFSTIPLGRRMY